MHYTRLGHTGLKVSRLCLGCMTYGAPTERWPWALDEDASRPFIQRALELGVNLFDTANVYSPRGAGPNDMGLSRKHVMSQVDASLRRLGTDYIDLYQIHRLDLKTPPE